MAKPSATHRWRQIRSFYASGNNNGGFNSASGISYSDSANRHSRIYAHILDLYFREMEKYRMLSEEDFAGLNSQLKNGERYKAERELVMHTLRYAISVAHHYCGRGVPFLDLIQAANCGLLTSARRFNPDLGKNFLTYADWYIRAEIFSDLRAYSRQVKIPHSPYEYLIKRTFERLTTELGCEPSIEEVADCLVLPVNLVRNQIFRLKTGRDLSLSGSVSSKDGDDRVYQDVIANREILNPEQYVEAKEELELADKMIRWFFNWVWTTFGVKTYVILCMRYGLDGTSKPKTYDKIADFVGLTRAGAHIHVKYFWKDVRRRGKKFNRKTESWLETKIEAITIISDLLNLETDPLDLLRDAPVPNLKKLLNNHPVKEIEKKLNH